MSTESAETNAAVKRKTANDLTIGLTLATAAYHLRFSALMKTGSEKDMRRRRIENWTGLVLMGDALAGLIWPCEYLRKLKVGPQPLNELLEAFSQRPVLTRSLCVLEMAFGAWIFRGR